MRESTFLNTLRLYYVDVVMIGYVWYLLCGVCMKSMLNKRHLNMNNSALCSRHVNLIMF